MLESSCWLDALLQRLPDELVNLQGEAGVDAVRQHPVDEGAGVEGGVVGGAERAGSFGERRAEEDAALALWASACAGDEVAGELVVARGGENELDLVVEGEGVEVFKAGSCWRRRRRRGT